MKSTKTTLRYVLLIAPFPICVALTFFVIRNWPLISLKLYGQAPDCPWDELLDVPAYDCARSAQREAAARGIKLLREDAARGLELLDSPAGRFWIQKQGRFMDGEALLAQLIADHEVHAARSHGETVRAGEVVIDCGAHVGVFVRTALRKGASLVVAVEIDPANLECLRRNFAEETKLGKVIIYPKGVWDRPGTLMLEESTENSGMGSLVIHRDGAKIPVEVTTLDHIVEQLKLSRVNFIKMDIEGAERNALKGAASLLAKHHPRLMLDTYHLPDDPRVFLSLLTPYGYQARIVGCVCNPESGLWVPSVTFWR